MTTSISKKKRYFRIALPVLIAAFLATSCNDKIDGSSEAAYTASLERMVKGKTEEENKELLKDMVVIAFYYEDAAEMRKAVHGKDRQQLKEFATHISELTRLKQEALAKKREEEARENERRRAEEERKRLEEEKRQEQLLCEQRFLELEPQFKELLESMRTTLAESSKLHQLYILSSVFEQKVVQAPGIPRHIQPVMKIRVENRSDEPISGLAFHTKLFSSGRTICELEDEFKYGIQGGLNPGETKELSIAPNQFSEWGKLEQRKYMLEARLLCAYNAQKEEIWQNDEDRFKNSMTSFWGSYDKVSDLLKKLDVKYEDPYQLWDRMGISNEYRPTLLHLAIKSARVEEVSALTKDKAIANTKSPVGLYPLYIAARDNSVESAKILLAAGAEINAAVNGFPGSLGVAARLGHVDMVKLLLDHGADVNAHNNDASSRPLHMASLTGNEDILNLLLEKGADINAKDKEGLTALHYLCKRGFVKATDILLKRGADVNIQTDKGITPIQMCCVLGNVEQLKMCLSHDSSGVNIKDEVGLSLLSSAILSNSRSIELVSLLLEAGADVNSVDTEYCLTPIFAAVSQEDLEVINLLISQGAKVNHRLKDGTKLLSMCKNAQIRKVLVKAGAK